MKGETTWVVVSRAEDLDEPPPRVRVVVADRYLAGHDPRLCEPGARVINLCRVSRYLSRGYYVSLVADARDQRVEPSVDVLRGLLDAHTRFWALVNGGVPALDPFEARERFRSLGLVELGPPPVRRNAGGLEACTASSRAEITVVLGRTSDKRFEALARRIHQVWSHPLLHVSLVRDARVWKVWAIKPLGVSELDTQGRELLKSALQRPSLSTVLPRATGFSLAVLYDPADPGRASNEHAMERLERMGARMGVHVQRIGLDDLGRLGEFDALWIRMLTGILEPSFRFAQRAEAIGMPVIDDTRSILRCGNKVWLHEMLTREGLAVPPSLVVTPGVPWEMVTNRLGCPVVLKLPDGSFSRSVVKVEDAVRFAQVTGQWLRNSPLLLAQAYRPTDYDWRVTVLGGKPLFVCKYHMAHGHWQIVSRGPHRVRYGKVEAIARDLADPAVVDLACSAASLLGDGLYGVDLKVTEEGPVIIEINDNPNLDSGYDDLADGARIYEDILRWFQQKLETMSHESNLVLSSDPHDEIDALREPIVARSPAQPPYEAFEVVGLEIEYAVVDAHLNTAPLVENVLRGFANRPTSDVTLGDVGLSNEIVNHVLEFKTVRPLTTLAQTERVLFEAVSRAHALLSKNHGAFLLPTGMHPWMDPRTSQLWTRSNRRIYETYARFFDVHSHGWSNVQATHVNLPLGTSEQAGAMMCAAALLIPYLPALAASSPVVDGQLSGVVDTRAHLLVTHQARLPESCGAMVPEYTASLAAWRKEILEPLYAAVDRMPGAGLLRHPYLNARGAVFKPGRQSMEVRILDTQECVKMDCAVASFVRGALQVLAARVREGLKLPDHAQLVADFQSVVRDGSTARVRAPHLLAHEGSARQALASLIPEVRATVPAEDRDLFELAVQSIAQGSLSERMRVALLPSAGDAAEFRRACHRLYEDLAQCLIENRPWTGRG